ncbi:MAG: hypothetical protein FJY65_01590 [Calditrichaeota bacterium]|nr:hypothetical protein [Calditrichota bacterium]
MKQPKPLLIALLICSIAGLLAVSAWAETFVVREFTAANTGQEVRLEWLSGSESGLSEFRVQRSFDGQNYRTIYNVNLKGSNNRYVYIDSDLFKGEIRMVHYRIEAAFHDGRNEWSKAEIVTLSFSGLRRTWGSIKAMFR